MLQAIFEFGDTIVREIMVARPDMVCCAADAPLDQLLRLILDSGHSRVPIFEGSVDRIVGVVYAKDLLRHWGARPDAISPAAVMRSPFFVPETKRIEDLLIDFRTRRVHMAIVVDEYGGTSGLITIEDLLEEIVGDIQDEHDLEEEWVQPQADGSLLLDARANVEELEEFFDREIPRDKFDTVGGFVVHLLGNVPVPVRPPALMVCCCRSLRPTSARSGACRSGSTLRRDCRSRQPEHAAVPPRHHHPVGRRLPAVCWPCAFPRPGSGSLLAWVALVPLLLVMARRPFRSGFVTGIGVFRDDPLLGQHRHDHLRAPAPGALGARLAAPLRLSRPVFRRRHLGGLSSQGAARLRRMR